jgi:anti-sigma regulatory factor (Ser/Thr protein kinase)
MQDQLVIELRSDLSEIRRVAEEVEAFGSRNKLPDIVIGHVNLALDELLTNTISYGFEPPAARRGPIAPLIKVTLKLDDGRLLVELVDNGKPFDPFKRADPDVSRAIEDREIGGLGIFLVRKLMDQVGYARVNDQNRVTLVKKTNVSGASAGSPNT